MSKAKLGELGSFKNGLNFSAEKVSSGCKIIGIPDFQDNYIAPKTGLGEICKDIDSDDYLLNDNDRGSYSYMMGVQFFDDWW